MTTESRTTDGRFLLQAEPFRAELQAHCYRMLGSVHDAADAVQDTYVRAWRAHDRFERRSSLRTWLYRIATRVCLTALASRNRRPLPVGLGGASTDPDHPSDERPDVPWLEPLPDTLLVAAPDDPATVVTSRENIRLAFVAALQHLPPRQRAALLLHDVVRWRAAEIAPVLGTSVAAVNGLLQRARARLDQALPVHEALEEPPTERERQLLDRYASAFERHDLTALADTLTEDAAWEMPPFLAWFRGRATIVRHLAAHCSADPGGLDLVPTRANQQPAFALHRRGSNGVSHLVALQVLTVTPRGISHVVSFGDLGLFDTFGFLRARTPSNTA